MSSEFMEKVYLIEIIIDRIMPISKYESPEREDEIDAEREKLVLRAGWYRMSVPELQALVNNGWID